jgi:pilus assembly protein Flp/PilA
MKKSSGMKFAGVVKATINKSDLGSRPFKGETSMKNLVSRFMADESGVTAIEYGLIAALIAVIIIGAVTVVGTSLSGTFSTVAGSL